MRFYKLVRLLKDIALSIWKILLFAGILKFKPKQSLFLIKNSFFSRAQLYQDLFALVTCNNSSESKYFIEIGCADGVRDSNTFLLERNFGFKGLIVEPAKIHLEKLSNSRLCDIDTRAVGLISGEFITFNETENATFSYLEGALEDDKLDAMRVIKNSYKVETVSVNDLLKQYNVPSNISYLSIDIEGLEYEILKSIDFNIYSFDVITVENNYTENESKIDELLMANGYERQLKSLTRFDSWYTKVTEEKV